MNSVSNKYHFPDKQVRERALELFKMLHGKGDAGNEHNFNCQNADLKAGWLKLARFTFRTQQEAVEYAISRIAEEIKLTTPQL